MASRELLLSLSREGERQRNDAERSVESGMDTLVGTKRTIQKLSAVPELGEKAALACTQMMNAGIAFRVMLQCHKKHHQREETPWVDPEGSTGDLLRSALSFEEDAETFANHLRQALKDVRKDQGNQRGVKKEPDSEQNRAPVVSSGPSIE